MKQALFAVVEGINTLIDERKKRQQQRLKNLGEKLFSVEEELGSARKQMTLDALTQLFNRGALDLQLERTASVSFFSGTAACILMVDVDHFKHINDTYGHPAGDVVMQQLANRLVSTFPRKTDFIAGMEGKSFVYCFKELVRTEPTFGRTVVGCCTTRGISVSRYPNPSHSVSRCGGVKAW